MGLLGHEGALIGTRGSEETLGKLLEVVQYLAATGRIAIKDTRCGSIEAVLPNSSQTPMVIDEYPYADKKLLCVSVRSVSSRTKDWLLHLDVSSASKLYAQAIWLIRFSRSELTVGEIEKVRYDFERERKILNMIETLRRENREPVRTDAESTRALLRSVAGTISYWITEIRRNTKGGNARKEFVEKLIEEMHAELVTILDVVASESKFNRMPYGSFERDAPTSDRFDG